MTQVWKDHLLPRDESVSPQTSGPARGAAGAQSQPEPGWGSPLILAVSLQLLGLEGSLSNRELFTRAEEESEGPGGPGPSPGHLHAC